MMIAKAARVMLPMLCTTLNEDVQIPIFSPNWGLDIPIYRLGFGGRSWCLVGVS